MITFIDPETPLREDVLQEENFARPDPNTPLQQFYRGANVFITGGTGFLGKVLIEKLLRSFPELGHVYLLMREKKGKSVEQRLDDLFDDKLYGKLLRLSPNIRDKIRIVNGDCAFPGLGLSPEDTDLLTREVNIVFHGAATVRFDERLQLAVAVNVSGTVNVLALAKQMENLKAIVHVSTAYSNCPHSEIDEKFYDPPMPYDRLIQMVEACPDDILDGVTPTVLGMWPNTYTYTKAAGENAVRQLGPGLPIVILRPSIVIGIRNDPLPGWNDNLYGVTGVMVGVGTGVLRTFHGDVDSFVDLVPVDMTVNAMIAAAWDIGTRGRESTAGTIPIYNYTSYTERPIKWGKFISLSSELVVEVPTSVAIWSLNFTMQKQYWVYWVIKLLLHTLLGWVIDTGLVLIGRERILGKIYEKIDRAIPMLSYFSSRSWKFPNNNVQALWLKLSDAQDKTDFMFDMKQLDWSNFLYNYVRGIRVFVMKEPLSNVPQAKKKRQRLLWIHRGVSATCSLILLTIAWFILSTIFTLSGPSITRQSVLVNV